MVTLYFSLYFSLFLSPYPLILPFSYLTFKAYTHTHTHTHTDTFPNLQNSFVQDSVTPAFVFINFFIIRKMRKDKLLIILNVFLIYFTSVHTVFFTFFFCAVKDKKNAYSKWWLPTRLSLSIQVNIFKLYFCTNLFL